MKEINWMFYIRSREFFRLFKPYTYYILSMSLFSRGRYLISKKTMLFDKSRNQVQNRDALNLLGSPALIIPYKHW